MNIKVKESCKSVMGIWGTRPRDVFPEIEYSTPKDMFDTLIKYSWDKKSPVYFKKPIEKIKDNILYYFQWFPKNKNADIDKDALSAARMLVDNFNSAKPESKKNERLSDFPIEDIVHEVAKEVKKQIDDGDTEKTASDVGYAVGKALNTFMPDILLNLAEDVMDKLDVFGSDYDSFFDAIKNAAENARE